MGDNLYATTRGRILGRMAAYIAEQGACEQCQATASLTVFWRDPKAPRPFRHMWALFNASEQRRSQHYHQIIVLCPGCMQTHKTGVGHGGGSRGIRDCPCDACRDKYRQYFAERVREHRKVVRARKTGGPRC